MRKAIGPLLLVIVIAGAVAWIYRSQSNRSQKFDLNPYHALGAGVAEETARLLGNQGSVVVIHPDTSEFGDVAMEGQLAAFRDAIRKHRGMTIAGEVKFKLTRMDRMATGGAVPPDQLLAGLQSHPNVGVVVLFCGFPSLDSQSYEALKQGTAKIIVASGYKPFYRKLLETRVIQLAIIPQFDRPAAANAPPGTLPDWFKQEFLVVTRENAAALPY